MPKETEERSAKMKNLSQYMIISALLGVFLSNQTFASIINVDPDSFTDHTVIISSFPGVTLSSTYVGGTV